MIPRVKIYHVFVPLSLFVRLKQISFSLLMPAVSECLLVVVEKWFILEYLQERQGLEKVSFERQGVKVEHEGYLPQKICGCSFICSLKQLLYSPMNPIPDNILL